MDGQVSHCHSRETIEGHCNVLRGRRFKCTGLWGGVFACLMNAIQNVGLCRVLVGLSGYSLGAKKRHSCVHAGEGDK